MDAAFRALRPHLPGARLEVSGGFERPPMERSAGVAALYALAQAAAAELGQTIAEGGTGGGSDGNFTAALGVPTLDGLGAIGDGAHAAHEHVEIARIVPRTALLAVLLQRLMASAGGLPRAGRASACRRADLKVRSRPRARASATNRIGICRGVAAGAAVGASAPRRPRRGGGGRCRTWP